MGAMSEWVKQIYEEVFYYNSETFNEHSKMRQYKCDLCRIVHKNKKMRVQWEDEDWLIVNSPKNTPMIIFKKHVKYVEGARYTEDLEGFLKWMFLIHSKVKDHEHRYVDIDIYRTSPHFHAYYKLF